MRASARRFRAQHIAILGLAILAPVLTAVSTHAQTPEAAAKELATRLVDAIAASDFAGAGALLTPDAVVTFQNGDVCKGRSEAEKYVKSHFVGKEALIQGYAGKPTVVSTTALDPSTLVVAGTSADQLTLSSGAPMVLDTRWTATVVNRDGQWQIASLHLSTNMLDNPVIEKMKMTSYLLAAFGLVMGLTLGAGVVILLRRRTAPPAGSVR